MSRPWEKYYGETAKNFDADAMEHGTLVELINHAGAEFANRPAMTTVLPNGAATTLNYAEWLEHSKDFAAYLRETAGLQRGETVAMMTPNCIDFTIAAAGAFLAGAICTNINPLYTAPEMEHQLNDSKAKVLVIIDMFGDKVDEVVGNTGVRQVVKISLLDFFPFMKKLIIGIVLKHVKKAIPNMAHAHVDFADALASGARARNGGDIAAYTAGLTGADSALFQYTSGTTGRSKGAELSHLGILANAAQASCLAEEIQNPAGDTTLVILPLYHITAFALIFVLGISGGDHMVLVPSPRPPSNLKTAFENFKVTRFTGINTLFAVLLEADWFSRDLVKDVVFCGSGGAAQQSGVAQRWAEATGVEIYQGYGMTECCGVMSLNPLGENRLGTVGIPVPGLDVRIVDDAGVDQPIGSPGELLFKGPKEGHDPGLGLQRLAERDRGCHLQIARRGRGWRGRHSGRKIFRGAHGLHREERCGGHRRSCHRPLPRGADQLQGAQTHSVRGRYPQISRRQGAAPRAAGLGCLKLGLFQIKISAIARAISTLLKGLYNTTALVSNCPASKPISAL